jgi:potassium-transporting ATPase KdpC subunit
MRRALLVSVRMALVTIVLFGLVYPLVVWGVTAAAFPVQSHGSLVTSAGTVVGSRLIGQAFASDRYFHPRPSAAGSGYDGMASGASNLGPTSKQLVSQVASRVAAAERVEGAGRGSVPVDLVTGSGSGLDPDVSPGSAYLQVPRIARVRGLPEARVRSLVAAHVTGRQLGFLGEPRVNVLELNLALEGMQR